MFKEDLNGQTHYFGDGCMEPHGRHVENAYCHCKECLKDKPKLMKKVNKKDKKREIIDFFKEAFCVDGEVKLVKGDFKIMAGEYAVELNDSKRGKFFIAVIRLEKTNSQK